jgi:putative tryptophan/tyrosine transport system substrate-binding protein
MKRREFITLLGGAVAWPFAVHAQQVMPVIGFLHGGEKESFGHLVAAFRQGLSESGYNEGKDVAIESRWANSQYDLLPGFAADLVRREVAVLVAGTPIAALAAKQATRTIPVVFILGSDPVKDGLVSSLSRPGGNITGATFFSNLLSAKRIELLHQLVPNAKVLAVLLNPRNANADWETNEAQKAASTLGLQLVFLEATTESDIDKSFANLKQQHADALLITSDALFTSRREQIAELAARYSIPTSYASREQATVGALMSYGANVGNTYRVGGNYVGRILNGEKPADLPVQQPTKFDLVINMRTAKALGLTVPNSVQLLADEVIE